MPSKHMMLGMGNKQEGMKQQEGRGKKREPAERRGR